MAKRPRVNFRTKPRSRSITPGFDDIEVGGGDVRKPQPGSDAPADTGAGGIAGLLAGATDFLGKNKGNIKGLLGPLLQFMILSGVLDLTKSGIASSRDSAGVPSPELLAGQAELSARDRERLLKLAGEDPQLAQELFADPLAALRESQVTFTPPPAGPPPGAALFGGGGGVNQQLIDPALLRQLQGAR